jgi:hypothetical protein
MLLARRGLRVLVLDRERLGRDTLSTRELLLALSRAQRAEDEAFDALHGEPAAA